MCKDMLGVSMGYVRIDQNLPHYHFFHVFDGISFDGGDNVGHPIEQYVFVRCVEEEVNCCGLLWVRGRWRMY